MTLGAAAAHHLDGEVTEVTEKTVLQEKRRNEDERSVLNHEVHEDHEDHEEQGRSIGPPEAASHDVRGRKYKPRWRGLRLVFAPSYIAAVGVLRTPTNRMAPPLVSVSPFLL